MTAVWVWLLVAASYMVLAGQFSLDEVVTGALLGSFGAAWHAAVMRAGARCYAFDRHALREIAVAVAGLPAATVKAGAWLARSLVGPVVGRRVEQVFAAGRQDVPTEAGRRAVVVLATSLAPDSYVLRVPLDEDVISYHAITGKAPDGDPRWPS